MTWARVSTRGPFTTEEVEDVKTFLLTVVSSWFSFWIPFSRQWLLLIQQLNYKLCPSAIVQASNLSPNILQTVTVMVCVPILHFVLLPRLHRYIPNMLHRLGIGSVLMFFQELAGMVIVLSSWEEYSTCPIATDSKGFAPIGDCVISRSVFLVNDTCTERELYKYCSRE